MKTKRIFIVGGVAGGASCAARLRRLDEQAEIHLIDRGPHVSFANCGLPYFVGGVIADEADLLVAAPVLFEERFNIRVRTGTACIAVDREKRTVTLRDLASGTETREHYDALVLAPGASPVRPPLPGIDLPGIFTLRSIPDSRAIREWIARKKPDQAVVVGGGFIGLEMAENLVHRGLDVTVVERLDQVLPPLDADVADRVALRLQERGVHLALGDGVAGWECPDGDTIVVRTESGAAYAAGLVILAIGVRPETELARQAGLELGPRGGIKVNPQMQTSDARIWAVGDAVEVEDAVSGKPVLVPLAGPANRQGRIAADAICGRQSAFRGVQGTAICGVFGLQVAATGASEKALLRAGITGFEKVYLHPSQHARYYPGAKALHLKILFRREDGRLLGAQAVGEEGVDRRIDVIAMAIQLGGTVFDLEEAEMCYAPQFGGAKDAVNFAGMVAADVLRGDMPLVHWTEPVTADTVFVDVRDPGEYAAGHHDGAINIPLDELRSRLADLPASNDVRVYCAVGQRGYLAARILMQNGRAVRNLSGGWQTRCA
ncbi:MAG TPA: FAD-dependent oxidoreductase [Terrimicrobiaceae bacterium]|nr:FAD-dependent oxidoreductase [Terrimicrobiaceae bacterium]